MKTIDLADLPALEPLVNSGSDEPILLKSHGQTVAAVLPFLSEDDLEDFVLSRSQKFQEILRRSEESLQREGGLTPTKCAAVSACDAHFTPSHLHTFRLHSTVPWAPARSAIA